MKDQIECLKSEELFASRVFTVQRDYLRRGNGKEFQHVSVVHPGAAVFIPVDERGMLYAIRQYRHSIGREILEFPAGTLKQGEDPLECAKREIQEEVGRAAKEWTSLGILYPAPGFCTEVQHLYLARGLTEASAELDEDEILEVTPLSVKEIEKAIQDGGMTDAKSIAIFFRARLLTLI